MSWLIEYIGYQFDILSIHWFNIRQISSSRNSNGVCARLSILIGFNIRPGSIKSGPLWLHYSISLYYSGWSGRKRWRCRERTETLRQREWYSKIRQQCIVEDVHKDKQRRVEIKSDVQRRKQGWLINAVVPVAAEWSCKDKQQRRLGVKTQKKKKKSLREKTRCASQEAQRDNTYSDIMICEMGLIRAAVRIN